MNRLGEILEERYPNRQAFTDTLGIEYIDPLMISKFAEGKANPIPKDAHKIADVLGGVLGEPLERIWHPSDLDYGVSLARQNNSAESLASVKKDIRSKVTVKKCYRIPKSTAEWFTLDKLQACGYTSGQSWYDACVRRLRGEYGAICKAKKIAAATDIATTA
jgi:hypothetical protein